MRLLPLFAAGALSLSSLASAQFTGTYYSGTAFQTQVLVRQDETVNFDWGTGSPDPAVPTNNFSARWTGSVTPAFSETYTFHVRVDDGVRLWVDGVQIINEWYPQSPTQHSGTRALSAGTPVSIQLEYYEASGGAVCELEWESASQPRRTMRTGDPGGLTGVPAIGSFLDGALPAGTPGTASGNWVLEDAYPNLRFRDPLTYTPEPGTSRIHVGSRQGLIEVFDNSPAAASKQTFLDLRDRVAVVWDGGFMGHAFHPEWGDPSSPNRNYFYVFYCHALPGTNFPTNFSGSQSAYFFDCYLRLSRFERIEGQDVADPDSELIMVNVRLFNGSHRGGGMFFRNDGFLYCSIGDQFRYTTAQDISSNFEGGVIRIDVDQQGGAISHAPRREMGVDAGFSDEWTGVGYFIPNDNPFQSTSGAVFEEFWTVGHRNPHRMTLDEQTQRIWSGEIGAGSREEINVIVEGGNYQWPYREGFSNFSYSQPANPWGVEQPPVIDFLRSEANAIIGGFVYRGTQHPGLYGRYICGDYGQQRIWALDYNAGSNTATKEYMLNFTPGSLCTFGQDHQGEVYLCGLGSNVPIRRLARDSGYPEAPTLLSQTGLFTSLANLTPRAGVVPYAVNTPLWSDGALKQRWMAVPSDGNPNSPEEQIVYSEQDAWSFPEGTVLIKHFETPEAQRLETRLMIHGETGWYGVTYKWNAAGTDATLLSSGLSELTTIGGQQVEYYYPSRTDCLTCHNMQAGTVLGLKTRQLNRPYSYPGGGTANQLTTLAYLGLFDGAPSAERVADSASNVAVNDLNASLDLRVRSYLDSNCSQCHQPGQGHSTIDARGSRMLPWQGLVDGGVTNDLGISGARVIRPGDLTRSILYQRVNSTEGCCAMPPLGRGLVDTTAVTALEQWIMSLDSGATFGSTSQSSTAFSGPAELAVDTLISGDHQNGNGSGPVTHTATEPQPYWDADLGTDYDLSRVRLWNRTDCCGERLSNFYVFLSPNPFSGTTVNASLNQSGVTATLYPGTIEREDFVDVNGVGRFVRIQKVDTGILSIAEFQFEGYAVGAGSAFAVSAGPDTTADLGIPLQLAGQVLTPNPPALSFSWSKVSGPGGGINFGGITSLTPTATFYQPGTFVVRLTATDGVTTAVDDLVVEVSNPATAPTVNAGPDFSIGVNSPTTIDATVGHPQPWTLGFLWQKVSGPGNVNIAGNQNEDPQITIYTAGTYVLRLTATSGGLNASDEVTVTVTSNNDPPVVDAGADFGAGIDVATTLDGFVTDTGPLASVFWEQISGPGGVNFLSIFNPASQAIFYVPGTYVLRLNADDGEFLVWDEVTVTVSATNDPPVVDAGPDLSTPTSTPLTLQGSVVDDTPGVAISWEKVSGPGGVNFLLIFEPQSDAIFYVPGTYVLRLTADDGEHVVTDEVTITVN